MCFCDHCGKLLRCDLTLKDYDSYIETRFSARESSSLAFAALGSSSSLVVLALTMEQGLDTNYPWLKWIGILFALFGIIYREVTILSVDRVEYPLLSKELRNYLDVRGSRVQKTATFVRRFIIRFFLFLPIVAWLAFAYPTVVNYFFWTTASVLLAATSALLSYPDLVRSQK